MRNIATQTEMNAAESANVFIVVETVVHLRIDFVVLIKKDGELLRASRSVTAVDWLDLRTTFQQLNGSENRGVCKSSVSRRDSNRFSNKNESMWSQHAPNQERLFQSLTSPPGATMQTLEDLVGVQ